MKKFSSLVTIKAPVETIWGLLTDAPAYPSWNPTVTKVDGSIALGQTITVHTTASPGRAFPVKVSSFEPPKKMIWSGGIPIPGLLRGARVFSLTPSSEGTVDFLMEEAFSGLLAGVLIPDLQSAFDEFTAGLKRAAEAKS